MKQFLRELALHYVLFVVALFSILLPGKLHADDSKVCIVDINAGEFANGIKYIEKKCGKDDILLAAFVGMVASNRQGATLIAAYVCDYKNAIVTEPTFLNCRYRGAIRSD